MALIGHPGFEKITEHLACNASLLGAWSGILFRFQSIEYPQPNDVLNGAGASWRGGRWNAPGISAIYGSTSDKTALDECKAHDRYYGVETLSPRLLVAVEARLERVLDLTSLRVRRRMGLAVHVWADEDWRQMQAEGRESLSQAIGRAVSQAGGSGLLAHSSAVRGGVNVVIFPRNLRAGETTSVVEGEKLEGWKRI